MKMCFRFALIACAAYMVVGCSSSNKGSSNNQGGDVHPKHPDLFVTITAKDGHSGRPFWRKIDDGYKPSSAPWAQEMSLRDRTTISCVPVYTGSIDTGDTFNLEVSVGEEVKETQKVVYEGKRFEVVLTDGVTLTLEPDPF